MLLASSVTMHMETSPPYSPPKRVFTIAAWSEYRIIPKDEIPDWHEEENDE